MRYQMKGGALYRQGEETPLAKIRGGVCGPEREIICPEGNIVLRTDIHVTESPHRQWGNVHWREYVMYSEPKSLWACARPKYADGEDPSEGGWPICRMPRVNHALVTIENKPYELTMESSRSYCLQDQLGKTLVTVTHRGIAGGWDVDADEEFTPILLCGLFVFCRYLEQENEFLIV